MRNMMFAAVAAATLLASANPATAAPTPTPSPTPVSLDLTGSMVDDGTYGNSVLSSKAANGLQAKVTGWQINQTTGAVTTAYVGKYSPGLGVTGLGDSSGASGYHQIDNAVGYTDFVLLQFNSAVTLNSVTLSSFLLGSATQKYNDFAVYAINVPTTTWDANVNLSTVPLNTSKWTTLTNNGNDGTVSTGLNSISSQWLIGAAFNSGGNDGFKLKSLSATAVPEPASWAMMIVGAGLVGSALRRQRRRAAVATAA